MWIMYQLYYRFNPDSYINIEHVKIPSCFMKNKLGYIIINPKQQNNWNYHLNVLKEQVEYWIKHGTEKTVEVVNLFYDAIEK
jgi:hypothetical protein